MDEPPATSPPEGPESGIELLHPASGTAAFRRRLERPAQVGRYGFAFLGAVTCAAAIGLEITRPSPVAVAFLAFGAAMAGLAVAQHLLLRRERAHRPERAYLQPDGIELHLANGEIRLAEWADTRFAVDAFVRPGRSGRPDEVYLGWRMDPKLPLCPITPASLDRLRAEVDAHRLRSSEFRAGGGRRAMRGFEFRPFPPAPPSTAVAGGPARVAP